MKPCWRSPIPMTRMATAFPAGPMKCGILLPAKKPLGRFGWKANQPNLRQQNAGAAVGDIGIATSMADGQNCTAAQPDCVKAINGGAPEMSDEFLDKLTLYTMTIAVPAQRNANDPVIKQGEELFRAMGCASCHMPTLQTKSVEAFLRTCEPDLPSLHRSPAP